MSILPGDPPKNICNRKTEKFKRALHCPLLSGRCYSIRNLSIISGLDPLVMFAPVVAMKYARAVAGRTREATPHMNPA